MLCAKGPAKLILIVFSEIPIKFILQFICVHSNRDLLQTYLGERSFNLDLASRPLFEWVREIRSLDL